MRRLRRLFRGSNRHRSRGVSVSSRSSSRSSSRRRLESGSSRSTEPRSTTGASAAAGPSATVPRAAAGPPAPPTAGAPSGLTAGIADWEALFPEDATTVRRPAAPAAPARPAAPVAPVVPARRAAPRDGGSDKGPDGRRDRPREPSRSASSRDGSRSGSTRTRSPSSTPQRFEARGGRADPDGAYDARYGPRSRRRRRVVRVALLVVGAGLLLGLPAADAYLQASGVLSHVRDATDGLKQVRTDLLRGRVPTDESFAVATRELDAAEQAMNGSRPTFGLIGHVPLIGLPVQATQRLVEATRHELNAALVARDILEEVIGEPLPGSSAERARAEAEAAEGDEPTTPEERKAARREARRQGGGGGGGNRRNDPPETNAILRDGKVDLKRLTALRPMVVELNEELAAAEEAVRGIGTVPFVGKANELRADIIEEVTLTHELVARGLTGLDLLPFVLGADRDRSYLLLFQDSGYLRGTGGGYFAFLDFSSKGGALELVDSAAIIEIDRYRNEDVPIPKQNWYLRTFPKSVRMNNLNWDPHFPSTARVAANIYKEFTGRTVDGVIQIDVTGVAYLLDAIGQIKVDAWPVPITAKNVTKIALEDSYVAFTEEGDVEGDATSGAERKAFNEQLVQATWERLQSPKNVVRTVYQLSRALAERHLQIWSRDRGEQDFFEELGWAGALSKEPGDYVYVVDQNLGNDTLDSFAYERVEYDVTVADDGSAEVVARVKMTNSVPAGLPFPIVPRDIPADKQTYVNLYAPGDAELVSVMEVDGLREREVKAPLVHTELGRKVFSARLQTKANQSSYLEFRYRVSNVLVEDDGALVYRLTVQRQPRVNDQSIRVRVTFPDGWSPDAPADGWTIEGSTATWFQPVTEDFQVELRF